jgi:Ca-activated chloride channel family protein
MLARWQWGLDLTDPAWLWGLVALPLLGWWSFRGLLHQGVAQRGLSLACRGTIVTLLVLILSGLTLRRPALEPFVVFAVDKSASIGAEGEAAARDYLDKALARGHGGQMAFLGFAAAPGPAGSDRATAMAAIDGEDARMGTDLGAAIEVAAGSIPPGYVPRIVLLTDGNATGGDARDAAMRAGAALWTVPLPARQEPEIQVAEVVAPTQVRQDEPFPIEVVVNSNHDDEGTLEISCNTTKMPKVGETRRKIKKGENRFAFQYRLTHETMATIRAHFTGVEDTRLDDNSARALVSCVGPPRVLIVSGDPRQAEHLADALGEDKIQVDPPRPPEGLPDSLAQLQNYDLVVLANVPATHPKLTQKHFQQLRIYVQQLGGGLLLIGGDHSFGPGGYARSVVEDLLPVYCDFRKEQEKPRLAMVLVLDKSGSMAEGLKLEMVKEAARGAVELLAAKDQVGIVAFDYVPNWVSELKPCSDKAAVFDSLARIHAEGGTLILPALEQAYQALDRIGNDARYKHVILLSDGEDNARGASDPAFASLVNQMSASRITVSCVGVGHDVDRELLESIARQGAGRCYFPEELASVPQIFAQETIQASKDALIEQPFEPVVVRPAKALAGIDWSLAPLLGGYVLTRPKPTSELVLRTPSYDPLLAWWRTGLGMCGAFTSDAETRWAEPWISNWPGGFSRFWAQVVRQLMRRQDVDGYQIEITRHGRAAAVTLDALDPAGEFQNEAHTELTVVHGVRTFPTRVVPQSAPGRYSTLFEADGRRILGSTDAAVAGADCHAANPRLRCRLPRRAAAAPDRSCASARSCPPFGRPVPARARISLRSRRDGRESKRGPLALSRGACGGFASLRRGATAHRVWARPRCIQEFFLGKDTVMKSTSARQFDVAALAIGIWAVRAWRPWLRRSHVPPAQAVVLGLLKPIRRRRRVQLALRSLSLGMVLGAIACAGLVLAERWVGVSPGPAAAYAVLAGVPLLAGLAGLARRPSWLSTAALVDDRCRLHDRASAALEFSRNRSLLDFERLQIGDAVEHLRAIRPDDVFPLHWPRETPVALCAVAIALAVLVRPLVATTPPHEPPGLFEPAVERARELEEPARQLQAAAKELESPALHAIAERMRKTIEELRRPGLDMRETMAKLSELQAFVAVAQEDYDIEAVNEELQSLGDAMLEAKPLEPAARALQKQKLDQAAMALEGARTATFDRREARAAGPRLAQSAVSMKNKGLEGLSRATKELAEGVDGNAERLKQGTQDLAKEIRDHDRRRRINELMAREQRRLSDCKKYCEARNLIAQKLREEEKKHGRQDRSSAESSLGKRNDDRSQGDPAGDAARNRQRIAGQAGDGAAETSDAGHSPNGERTRARRPSRKVHQKYERESEAVLESEPIPLGHRESIRRYFELIRPSAADKEEPEEIGRKAGEP